MNPQRVNRQLLIGYIELLDRVDELKKENASLARHVRDMQENKESAYANFQKRLSRARARAKALLGL